MTLKSWVDSLNKSLHFDDLVATVAFKYLKDVRTAAMSDCHIATVREPTEKLLSAYMGTTVLGIGLGREIHIASASLQGKG